VPPCSAAPDWMSPDSAVYIQFKEILKFRLRQSTIHLENMDQVSPISTFLQCPETQFSNSLGSAYDRCFTLGIIFVNRC
jgi:hypothetical protein